MKIWLGKKCIPIKEAITYKERLIGLMGQKNIDFGMLFKKCNAVHTYFMKENIDIIGLNDKNEIIFLEKNVIPNKMLFIHQNIKKTSVLELPHNTSDNLSLGDKIIFELD